MDRFWTAVQVRPKREGFVANSLCSKGFETFLPLYSTRRRWSDRIKDIELPLFAGYVFCLIDPMDRLPVLTVPNVLQIVGIGKTPLPIEESEILAIQSVMRSGLPSVPWPFLEVGQKVRVDRGPLRDMEGILIQVKGSHRIVVSISLLQRSVAVELDRDWITPFHSRSRTWTTAAGLPISIS